MKYHLERAINVITRVENEHLDYTAQMKRLEDVASRFAPLMHRLDTNLPSIQEELGLPRYNSQLPTGDHKGNNLFLDGKLQSHPLYLNDHLGDEKNDENERKSSPRILLIEDEPLEEKEGNSQNKSFNSRIGNQDPDDRRRRRKSDETVIVNSAVCTVS